MFIIPKHTLNPSILSSPTLASSTLSHRAQFPSVPRRTDEDFINRSLLDSLDAQADAEPVSSSDSEAAAVNSFGSASDSSSGSPSAPYHFAAGMQSQQQQQQQLPPRSDSPPSNIINNNSTQHHLKSAAPESMFNNQNTHHNMYNNIHIQPDYSDLDSQPKGNGFGGGPGTGAGNGPYRTSTSFNAFSNNRMRPPPTGSVQYRDTPPSAFNPYPTAADVFPVHQMTSPTQQHQQPQSASHPFEMHQGRGFDFGGNGAQGGGSAVQSPLSSHNTKQPQYGLDLYGSTPPSSAVLQSHQVGGGKPAGGGAPPGLHPQPSHQQQALDGYPQQQQQHAPYLNGLHLQSQTPYGPHLQTNGPGSAGPVPTSAAGPPPNSAAGMNGMSHLNGANGGAPPNSAQEEISTIFVVGFPEDMQEREFQNMFTFSAGFEAATLKIPNKEYTAYGGPGGNAPPGSAGGGPGSMSLRGPGAGMGFTPYGAGSNDPYNLVTVNQGGVVVDGGRDGTTASWPSSVTIPSSAAVQDAMDANGHFGPTQAQNAMPPRKQIIGFAKFRSRQEALDARDVLQGRRVDIEKGAVLKAEMAKKNLHTKRGVGLMGVGVGGSGGMMGTGSVGGVGGAGVGGGAGGMQNEALAGIAALNMNGLPGGGEAMSARERELGALGAMGFGGLNQWREHRAAAAAAENGPSREEEENQRRRDREQGALNAMGLGGTTRGPRERAEDDEREREKRRKEKEARLRSSNSTAFDAFHSVPPQSISRAASNSLLSPTSGAVSENGNSPLLNGAFAQQANHSQEEYGSVGAMGPWGDVRKVNMPASATLPARPTSPSRPPSPPHTAPFSPPLNDDVLPHASLPIRPRPTSPLNDIAHQQFVSNIGPVASSSVPASSASSNAGESHTSSIDVDMMKSLGDLDVGSGLAGNTSPQLPSPGSSGSSNTKANAIDQNPPINTLYVGNLPTSQVPPGYPTNYLEDSLRELFQRRAGYRKLCFRQKSNGPMCFVEFDDVSYATKALSELYGNTLNGLIKGGGIRLSYSKNPLGVRTPTSAGSSGPSLQQQQQQNNALQQGLASPFPVDAFQPRQQGDDPRASVRREMSNATSPHPSYTNYTMSPPPPRFFSPPPASSAYSNALGDNNPQFSRVAANGNGYFAPPVQSSMSSFSPFGMSSPPHVHTNIPESASSELDEHHYPLPHRALSPPSHSIEVARAG